MSPSLSLIIPAYNEAARLGKTLSIVFDYLNDHARASEVIVVDDGSSDETATIAEQSVAHAQSSVSAKVIRNLPNRGKGHAVRTGLLAARAPIAIFSDADLSTPITEMPRLVDPIERGLYDLTFGSRALDRSLIGVHQPWRREQGGRVINLIVRMATRLPFWDTQCGFKAFRMSVCLPLIEATTIDRFGFDVEYLMLAHLAGLRLSEIPVRWDHNDGSKLSVWRDTPRLLNEVRTIRQHARDGTYTEAIRAARELAALETQQAAQASEQLDSAEQGVA